MPDHSLPVCLFLCVCLIFCNRSVAQHELVDGPANVRNDPERGKIVFILNDSVPVSTADSTGKMYLIALPIRITAAQYGNFAIEKDTLLYAENGTIIGKTVGTAKLLDAYKKGDQLIGVLYGYTAVQNIRQATLPENRLGALLEKGPVIQEAQCDALIRTLQMSPSVIGGYKVYLFGAGPVYGSSKTTRLMLAFDKGVLFAVVHLRVLPFAGGERLNLKREYFMTIPGKPDKEKVMAFLAEVNKFIENENTILRNE